MKDRVLTDFQTSCERSLVDALRRLQLTVVEREVLGESETYIRGRLDGIDLTFWIYEDGADFKTPIGHPRFERLDFTIAEDLASAFVCTLVEAAEEMSRRAQNNGMHEDAASRSP